MPRHNCSHMERFFRNVLVITVPARPRTFNPEDTMPTEDIWFWTKPAKNVKPLSPHWRRTLNWDVRFYNDGQQTPVQRWIFYQATAGQSWRGHIPLDPFHADGWLGDEYKIFDLSNPIFVHHGNYLKEYLEEHPGCIPIMTPYQRGKTSNVLVLNPEYKIVSPWHLTQTDQNKHKEVQSPRESIKKVTPLRPDLHMPELGADLPPLLRYERRLAMLRAYAAGNTDAQVIEMIENGEI